MKNITGKERQKYKVYKELEKLVFELNYTVDALLVEGPHDKKTLKFLGYKRPILICSRLSLTDLTDLIVKKFSNVVILTDFDKQGMILNKRLSNLLEHRGVEVNHFYRRKLGALLKEVGVLTIEGIYRIKLELFS